MTPPATVAKPPVIIAINSDFVILSIKGLITSGASVCPTKILAEILDQDLDGIMDDSTLFEYVSNWQTGWLAMPTNHNQWESNYHF